MSLSPDQKTAVQGIYQQICTYRKIVCDSNTPRSARLQAISQARNLLGEVDKMGTEAQNYFLSFDGIKVVQMGNGRVAFVKTE
jgi:hypothetical protein